MLIQKTIFGFLGALLIVSVALSSSAHDGQYPELSIIHEAKINTLSQAFKNHEGDEEKLEASGVTVDGEFFLVVFDNMDKIAKIHKSLVPHPENGFVHESRQVNAPLNEAGYEGITRIGDTVYALIEGHGKENGAIIVYMENGAPGLLKILDMEDNALKDAGDKGFEGLAHFRVNSDDFLLALCEGNKCKRDGKDNRGRIQVFEKCRTHWQNTRTIKLNDEVDFEDYSGIAVRPQGRMAIVSQEDSAIWIGRLSIDENKWVVITEKIFNFPRADEVSCFGETYTSNDGKPMMIYRNIEGVAWVDDDTLITVSDRRKDYKKKKNLPYKCKDQSIQLIKIPQ